MRLVSFRPLATNSQALATPWGEEPPMTLVGYGTFVTTRIEHHRAAGKMAARESARDVRRLILCTRERRSRKNGTQRQPDH